MTRTSLVRLSQRDAAAAFALAERDPDRCTFIAGWIHDGGLSDSPRVPRGWLLGEMDGTQLLGLLYLSDSGILVPAVNTQVGIDEVIAFGQRQPDVVRVIVGERNLVETIWSGLERRGARARLVRDQLAFAIQAGDLRSDSALSLERATENDLDEVVHASAAMAREEARDDPEGRNPHLFRMRILERVRRGRDFLHRDLAGHLDFKANVSALSSVGGQIEGIYTLPEVRRRGLGKAGTATITRWVLSQCGRAFLLVNEDNDPARALYESLGYRQVGISRTLFVAP
ncbi:MAG: GNAT family N-acetyltransferase [Deltaproteobacteria bacterium]|nr:GNAT family N-acetyltransferase [Deltaproteobacteria bacterium]